MNSELRDQIIEECKIKCTCPCYDSSRVKRRGSSSTGEDSKNEYDGEQRTFFTFVTETISVIAFLVFGSVVFWLAVGGILFDFFKKLYYSDRYVKFFIAGLVTLLLLSMSIRVLLNKRACRAAYVREKEKKQAAIPPAEPPKPPPEYMVINLHGKNLEKKKKADEIQLQPDVPKKLTLTIVNEKKKEVYKESKTFFIPAMAMEMKKPPPLIVYLKNLIIDDY